MKHLIDEKRQAALKELWQNTKFDDRRREITKSSQPTICFFDP